MSNVYRQCYLSSNINGLLKNCRLRRKQCVRVFVPHVQIAMKSGFAKPPSPTERSRGSLLWWLPGRVDPPWWGSAEAGGRQGAACVAVRWSGCNVWTHLKEPVAAAAAADAVDAGRRGGGGSSHPGSRSREVRACLGPSTGVSAAGCRTHNDNGEFSKCELNRHKCVPFSVYPTNDNI